MRRQGFTLIELLIVIAIAAIIAGAMVPMFNVTRQDARKAKASSELDTIKTAAIMLRHDTSTWPPTGAAGLGLTADTTTPTPSWAGPYLDQWNSDPWTMSYTIAGSVLPTGPEYICSSGPDKSITGALPTAYCTGTDDQRVLIHP